MGTNGRLRFVAADSNLMALGSTHALACWSRRPRRNSLPLFPIDKFVIARAQSPAPECGCAPQSKLASDTDALQN
jgi:hypothetical protein